MSLNSLNVFVKFLLIPQLGAAVRDTSAKWNDAKAYFVHLVPTSYFADLTKTKGLLRLKHGSQTISAFPLCLTKRETIGKLASTIRWGQNYSKELFTKNKSFNMTEKAYQLLNKKLTYPLLFCWCIFTFIGIYQYIVYMSFFFLIEYSFYQWEMANSWRNACLIYFVTLNEQHH